MAQKIFTRKRLMIGAGALGAAFAAGMLSSNYISRYFTEPLIEPCPSAVQSSPAMAALKQRTAHLIRTNAKKVREELGVRNDVSVTLSTPLILEPNSQPTLAYVSAQCEGQKCPRGNLETVAKAAGLTNVSKGVALPAVSKTCYIGIYSRVP